MLEYEYKLYKELQVSDSNFFHSIYYYILGRRDYSTGERRFVTFTPNGPDEMTVQFSVVNDNDLEFNETFMLELQLLTGLQIAQLGRKEAEVTIINDDCKSTMCLKQQTELILIYSCTTVLPKQPHKCY